MNCFGIKSHLSELIDGTLLPSQRQEFDRHIESCPHCSKKISHYRTLIQAISNVTRHPLPLEFRQNPSQYQPRRLGWYHRSRNWGSMPSSIRGGVEAITLAAGIVFLILMIPRARTLYETRIHNQLEALNLTEFLKPSKTPNASPTTTQSEVDEGSGDVSSEYGDDSDAEDDAPGAKRGEIWRINVRVANVRDAQTKTQEILAKSGASRVESGALGIEAPGGIQFDLQIKLDEVSTVRTALRSLALPEPEEVDSGITEDLTEARRQLPPRKSFTWYKSRSKEPLPEGKVRLVIWLSQM